MNYEELKDWCDEARRSVGREMDRLQEQQLTMGNHLQVLEAAGDLLGEMERQKDELEQKQQDKSGDGESTLRSWQNRGYIAYDEVSGRYCKTEAYMKKFGKKS